MRRRGQRLSRWAGIAPVPRQAVDSIGPAISNADILSSFVIIPADAAGAAGEAAQGVASRVAEGGHDDRCGFPEKPQ